MAVRICPRCGVPRRINRENLWLDNGTIVERRHTAHRMIFFERDNLVDLHRLIEESIGAPLRRIIIESHRKATYDYVVNFVPPLVRKLARLVGLKALARNMLSLGTLLGFGEINLQEISFKRSEEDYFTVRVRNPWFIDAYCGLLAGGMEAITGHEASVKIEETGPEEYMITAYISRHPKEFEERLQVREYPAREGDIGLERCPGCGGPLELEQFEWDTDMGTIVNRATLRRMVFSGPGAFEALFDELERELGEHVPEVIVEAQRRFVTEGFYSLDDIRQEPDIRNHFALRGLGNASVIELGTNRLFIKLENACLHQVMVGMIKGFFQLIFNRDGKADWVLGEDGILEVEVT